MGILFAISIFAFCALLWAAVSIARHIRATKPAEEPFVAVETQKPTQPRVISPVTPFEPEATLPVNGRAPAAPTRPRRPSTVPSNRMDWAYFNKDLGDLNDSPQTSRSRTPKPPASGPRPI
jgi:hypothetical protein